MIVTDNFDYLLIIKVTPSICPLGFAPPSKKFCKRSNFRRRRPPSVAGRFCSAVKEVLQAE